MSAQSDKRRRCIDCGERWATSTADDVCDECRFAHEQAFKRAIDALGMTLRDYFAAAALSAGWATDACGPKTPANAAASAYAFADAMLEERAK